MCGRYQAQFTPNAIIKHVQNLNVQQDESVKDYSPRQQIYPTNLAPVVVAQANSQQSEAPAYQLATMKWGFNQPQQSSYGRLLINARHETLLELPTFRRQLTGSNRNRCVIPCTGFFEWHKSPGPGKQMKTPYLIRASSTDDISFMAAVYQTSSQQDEKSQFVIITTAAAQDFEWLHHRQPCFLNSQSELDTWLDTGIDTEQAIKTLHSQRGFKYTRMLKDLSGIAGNGKRPRQNTIDSFFKPNANKKARSNKPLAADQTTDKRSQKASDVSNEIVKEEVDVKKSTQQATNKQEQIKKADKLVSQ